MLRVERRVQLFYKKGFNNSQIKWRSSFCKNFKLIDTVERRATVTALEVAVNGRSGSGGMIFYPSHQLPLRLTDVGHARITRAVELVATHRRQENRRGLFERETGAQTAHGICDLDVVDVKPTKQRAQPMFEMVRRSTIVRDHNDTCVERDSIVSNRSF